MALDPLSTLSAAAVVVQFVDFAKTIVCKSRELYCDSSGALKEDQNIMSATKRLEDLVKELDNPLVGLLAERELDALPAVTREEMRRRHTQITAQLSKIRRECFSVSKELLERLLELQIPPRAQFRKWKSFRQALKSVWTKHEIDAKARRLDELRKDLDTHVLVLVRESQALSSLVQEERFKRMSEQTQTLIKKLAGIQTTGEDRDNGIMERFEVIEAEGTQKLIKQLRGLQDDFKDKYNIHLAQNERILENLADFKEYYLKLSSSAVTRHLERCAEKIEQNILDSLRFAEIANRYEAVATEYEATYRWVLEKQQTRRPQSWNSLVDWLTRGSGVYWIQGKAASGKSTLMKYIWNSEKTDSYLDAWRGAAAFTSGIFFFWCGGTAEERSQQGLLRSLLYSVLKWRPELISEVFSEEWSRKSAQLSYQAPISREKWSLSRLQAAFEKLVTLASDELKMCFFIDGLDEYEGHPEEIAEYVVGIAHSSAPHVKFCVSSRPWPVFLDILAGTPGLKLQDLNRLDIQHYVRGNLEKNAQWRYLSDANPCDAASLMQEAVEKSAGVFLWVVLTVRSLITGMRNGDDFPCLRSRLALLPSELEKLFDVLMQQIDPTDRAESSKIFQIFRASGHQLDILTLHRSLLYSDIQDLLNMPLDARATGDENAKRIERAKLEMDRFWMRVNSRTMGLLEAPSPKWKYTHVDWWETENPLFVHSTENDLHFQRICYLHRTVKDYLELPQVWSQIRGFTSDAFEPCEALLMSIVVEAKTVGPSLGLHQICDAGLELFVKAARLNLESSENHDIILEHLDDVLTRCAAAVVPIACHHWSELNPWGKAFYGSMSAVVDETALKWYVGTQERVPSLGMCQNILLKSVRGRGRGPRSRTTGQKDLAPHKQRRSRPSFNNTSLVWRESRNWRRGCRGRATPLRGRGLRGRR